ncbi:Flp family type IVb pilin [Hoeflea alexandrii]|uniref:Flp family type IVb pilin n=1 Tax=Hoeflea alexandrii TaxID=288436 RepID=UPI002F34FA04
MMKVLCTRAADCESGATAIEYALIASILSMALLTGAATVGSALKQQFGHVSHKLAGTSAQHAGPGGGTSLIALPSRPEGQTLTATQASWQEQ